MRCIVTFGPVFGRAQAQFAGDRFAIPEQADDFQNVTPCREDAAVCFFEPIDGHQEQKLLFGHLALFGRFRKIAPAASGASAPLQARALRVSRCAGVVIDFIVVEPPSFCFELRRDRHQVAAVHTKPPIHDALGETIARWRGCGRLRRL